MSIGRLLRACGWTEQPGTGPLTHDYDLAFAVIDPPRVERFATVIGLPGFVTNDSLHRLCIHGIDLDL